MTLETEFREAAQELVAEFSTGTHTLRKPNGVYDPVTGVVTNTPADTTAPMAQSEIDAKEVDSAFIKDHMQFIIAGADIDPVEPEMEDQIITPAGTTHEVVRIQTDQYKAAYIVYAKRG